MSKTILITGASSGFGRLTAEKLASEGHHVFAGFRSFDGQRKAVAEDLKSKKIETPAGKRPARVVVGMPFGTDALNNTAAPIQHQILDSLGLGFLSSVITR